MMTPGSTIAHYKIVSKLGEGGMGAVYRATDGKLQREVAIKVLPDVFAADPDRLMRFMREAQVLAALHHPNIATVFGIEERAIVMELVEGPTLADRLQQGPLALEEALGVARQIAEALEEAHEKGITHRDLKPANVKVNEDGKVKVLDFGLAKLNDPGETVEERGVAPTVVRGNSPTMAGMIMGTADYMSPEQASGKRVDRRSDIWSFGVVLWEMLSGVRLFDGETVSHTLAHVLTAPIDFGKLPGTTPGVIVGLIERCLERDPKKRLQAIGEARLVIEKYLANPGAAAVAAAAPAVQGGGRMGWVAWALAAALAAGLGWVSYRHANEGPGAVVKATLLMPEGVALEMKSYPAVSPDGKRIAYAGTRDGKTMLYVRDVDGLTPRSLAGTEDAMEPFWSPDSQSIGFFGGGKLKRLDLAGGAVVALAAVQGNAYGGSWSERGVIVFPKSPTGGLFRVSAGGGAVTPATALHESAGEVSHRLAWFLPDGRHFLFLARNNDPEKSGLYVGDLDSTDRKLVKQGNIHGVYVAGAGRLLYTEEATVDCPLMAQAMDLGTFQLSGEPMVVAESVDQSRGVWGQHHFSSSANGTLVYVSSGGLNRSKYIWMDRTGRALGSETDRFGELTHPAAISPDERTVAYAAPQADAIELWLRDLVRGTASRFTFSTGATANALPAWSPDGKWLYYATNWISESKIVRKATTGGGVEEPVFANKAWRGLLSLAISGDGRYLVTSVTSDRTRRDIWVIPAQANGEPQLYLASEASEAEPSLSPDNRWLAYTSDETKRAEVYVQTFPSPGRKRQVSANGGSYPMWSKDGKELYYIGPDRKMMAVAVRKSGEDLEFGNAVALFDSRIAMRDRVGGFEVTRDGRFLIPVPQAEQSVSITLVTNWAAGLRR